MPAGNIDEDDRGGGRCFHGMTYPAEICRKRFTPRGHRHGGVPTKIERDRERERESKGGVKRR